MLLARDSRIEDQSAAIVACKVINLAQNKRKEDRQQVEKEVELLQRIPKPHPNIVVLYAALQTKSNLYLFMEYCDQGDLKDFIKSRSPKSAN